MTSGKELAVDKIETYRINGKFELFLAFIYNPALSVWVITKSNSSENPRGFNIKFEMYGKKQ